MPSPGAPCSQIAFLYYRDLAAAEHFYAGTLGLEKVEDQGFAKIYRVAGQAFVGLVDETRGSLRAPADPAEAGVLLTLVVDDVPAWHARLVDAGVNVLRGPGVNEAIEVEYLFVEDPGGYQVELQTFRAARLAETFGHRR